MRDINRIPVFTTEFNLLWMKHFPDWRFCQLMMNFISWLQRDPFYLEDDTFLEYFKEFCEAVGCKS